jgi:hypothetical protein
MDSFENSPIDSEREWLLVTELWLPSCLPPLKPLALLGGLLLELERIRPKKM